MSIRSLSRMALHWLVIVALITTALVVPAQAAEEAVREAATAQVTAVSDMPCGDEMGMAPHHMPCDCCTPASCDLFACLGTACLLELPRVAAAVPLHMVHEPWDAPARPTRLIDTPLRPPIS
jgi:hypothetical protein